jgi:hypothetical protein
MNRKNLWFLPVIALMLGVAFSSCKKDDVDISGTYKGKLEVPAMGQAPASTIDNVDLVVGKKDGQWELKMNKTITIAGAIQLPLDVTCPITASDKDGKTAILGTTTVVFPDPIPNPMNPEGEPIPGMPVSINGNIDASGNATVEILIMSGTFKVVFTGKK